MSAAAVELTQSDIDSIVPKPRAKAAVKRSGRGRFAKGCAHRQEYVEAFGEEFGITDDDFPDGYCPKFAHLPGNGRGPKRTSIFRHARVIFVGFIKPLFYLGLLYCAYLLLSTFLSGLPFGNYVPGPEFGVPADTRPASDGSIPADPGSVIGFPAFGDSRAFGFGLT